MTSCICLDASLFSPSTNSTTELLTISPGETLQFSYSADASIPLQLWVSSKWAQSQTNYAPINSTINKRGQPSTNFCVITLSSGSLLTVTDNHYKNATEKPEWKDNTASFQFDNPNDDPLQFLFTGIPSNAAVFSVHNVSMLGTNPSSPSSVFCFNNQVNTEYNDHKVACQSCTTDNIFSGCLGGISFSKLTYIDWMLILGGFIVITIFIKRVI